MKLTYYDDFAFAIQTKSGVFAINPSQKDEKVLFSIFTPEDRDQSMNGKFISWPGEYEFGGVAVQTFEFGSGKNTLGIKILSEEVRLLFLPEAPQSFSEAEKELIGNIDVLIVQVEESDVAKKVVEEIEPKVIIPVGSQREKFLGEMGAGGVENTEEFSFEVGSLPSEQTQFVKLVAL